MKKIICLFLSFNLTFANLENFNVGTWNLQGSSAVTESKWSVSVRQLVSGANPLDILMIQEAGTLPRTATPTGHHVQLCNKVEHPLMNMSGIWELFQDLIEFLFIILALM